MVLTRVKEEFRDKWIKARAGYTVHVNPKFPSPNYIRKDKRLNRDLRFHLESVIGVKKDYRDTYMSRVGLVRKVAKFLNDKEEQPETIPASRRVSVNPPPIKPRRLSIILSDTPGNSDHEDDGEEICRIPSFNMNLLNTGSKDDLTPLERRMTYNDDPKTLFPPKPGAQRSGVYGRTKS
jgi:hypothetical protein